MKNLNQFKELSFHGSFKLKEGKLQCFCCYVTCSLATIVCGSSARTYFLNYNDDSQLFLKKTISIGY